MLPMENTLTFNCGVNHFVYQNGGDAGRYKAGPCDEGIVFDQRCRRVYFYRVPDVDRVVPDRGKLKTESCGMLYSVVADRKGCC